MSKKTSLSKWEKGIRIIIVFRIRIGTLREPYVLDTDTFELEEVRDKYFEKYGAQYDCLKWAKVLVCPIEYFRDLQKEKVNFPKDYPDLVIVILDTSELLNDDESEIDDITKEGNHHGRI